MANPFILTVGGGNSSAEQHGYGVDDEKLSERQFLLRRILDAVKQCQVRFGGRSELATGLDSRVSCLCKTWEDALQHGLRDTSHQQSSIRQLTELAGLGKVSDFFSEDRKQDTEPVFWHYVKEHLTRHEVQRFDALKIVNTEIGRGRAWLRASLNEHALERYMHILTTRPELIRRFYHDWAFLCDIERSNVLPTMSAGLGSIIFAIVIDHFDLNKTYHAAMHYGLNGEMIFSGHMDDELSAVVSNERSLAVMRGSRRKKKGVNVVNLDDGKRQISPNIRTIADDYPVNCRSTDCVSLHLDSVVGSLPGIPGYPQQKPSSSFRKQEHLSNNDSPSTAEVSDIALSSVFGDASLSLSCSSLASVNGDVGQTLTPVRNESVTVEFDVTPLPEIPADSSQQCSVPVCDNEDPARVFRLAPEALCGSRCFSERTIGDGGYCDPISEHIRKSFSPQEGDLVQAVESMTALRDQLVAENRLLKTQLERQMDISASLRASLSVMDRDRIQQHVSDQDVISKLQGEIELLKHQLKKYVKAVQLLRKTPVQNMDVTERLPLCLDGVQATVPPLTPAVDYSHEAHQYEQKLIQVAEMHGELIEFNESLHRQLYSRDVTLRQLREELVSLRGPLSHNDHLQRSLTSPLVGCDSPHRTLINIWVPSAFLRGETSNNQHHVYQVYVRIRDDEWNVYRRYSQFLDLHTRIKKVYPVVGNFEFPAKKSIGNKEAKLVETRRRTFQTYLRCVINVLLERHASLASEPSKSTLVALVPFFGDSPDVMLGKMPQNRQMRDHRGLA